MREKNKLSIIVVHYGNGDEVYKCLTNLHRLNLRLKNTEYIFVDNNESESKKLERFVKQYRWIKYIKSSHNLGWAGGRNLGVKYATGDYYLFLDSDTTIDYKSVTKLLLFIQKNKKVGLVSSKLDNISGKYHGNASLELTPLRGIFFLSVINKLFPKSSVVKKYLMSEYDRKTTRKVDVSQLAVFIMRKSAYDSIKGFDENIFLYFEENDLSLSLRKKGWEIYLLPSAKAIHLESKGTPKSSQAVKDIFKKSRYYYFKKHYGFLSAILVDFFSGISKTSVLLMLILLLAVFLRFYRFIPNLMFSGEMGTDYMNIWNILHGNRSWLIGPRTSHEWFFISPIAYWVYSIIMLIWNYNPISINIFWGIIGAAFVPVCYITVKKIFNKNIASISSFLLAVSPAWIMQARNSRYNPVSAILFLPYLLFLRDSLIDKGKSLFKLGLVLGLTMSFFPSPLLLIPASIVSFIYFRVKPKIKYVLGFVLGFIIPNITFIIYEISNKFAITTKLITWVPYRVLGFFGLYNKNTVDSSVLSQNFTSIYRFFAESFVGYSGLISMIIFILIIVSSLFFIKKQRKDRKKEMGFFLIIINLVVCYLGLFIHGNPPPHYYLVIFPISLLLAAYILDKVFNNKYKLIISTLIIGIAAVFGLIKLNWYGLREDPINYKVNLVPYSTQLKIADSIAKDSKGDSFAIKRIGTYDEFENNFANNYIYLLTIRGAKIDNTSHLTYTIIEGKDNYQELSKDMIFSENEVCVFKTKI